jgi:hypothetical protein
MCTHGPHASGVCADHLVIIAGHALVQNLHRGLYELAVEVPAIRRVAVAFGELAVAI